MISIITCIFNQSKQLFDACALSVATQRVDFEWIIVDDGSSASAKQSYIRSLAQFQKQGQVKFISLDRNRGLSFARNVGISQARGEWIIILDSDDELMPCTAEILLSLSDASMLACFEVNYLKTDGAIEHRRIKLWENLFKRFGNTTADPFLWFDFYYHGMMARKMTFELIGGYDTKFRVGEDQDVLVKACEKIGIERVTFIHKVGYQYRQNPNGVCAKEWKMVEANYVKSMLSASQRRGAKFDRCRFVGRRLIDGAQIEEYNYGFGNKWVQWEEASEDVSGHKESLREGGAACTANGAGDSYLTAGD